MISTLSLCTALTALISSARCALGAARNTYLWVRITPTLVLLQIAIAVQAGAVGLALARGHRPAQLPTHLAYLVTTLAVLPVAARQAARDDGRWAALLMAGSLLVLAILMVRLQTTWHAR